MKLFQAIVASSVETLDNRQGLGLVECSQHMPEPIKQQARSWGYSSDANGKPIFSLKHIEASGGKWVVMNRTVPATDFTGRASHVSHTIALRLEDLKNWNNQHPGHLVSPFEFMLRFMWKDAWNGTPRWIEAVEEFELDGNVSSHPLKESMPLECSASALLLSFEFQANGKPRPKRLAWKSSDLNSTEMLSLFHQAWIVLDPWRGERKYGNYLGEPESTLAESWDCTFTTNLRDEPPDPYQWVVLSGRDSSQGNREIVDPTSWQSLNEETISNRIGQPFGNLLVARSQNSEIWAQQRISRLLEEIKQTCDATIEGCRIELERTADGIFSTAENDYANYKKSCDDWDPYLRKIDKSGLFNGQIEYLDGIRQQLKSALGKAESLAAFSKQIYTEKFNELMTLRKSEVIDSHDGQDDELMIDSDLKKYRRRYESLEERLRPTMLYIAASKIADDLTKAAEKNERIITTLKVYLDDKERILNSLYKSGLNPKGNLPSLEKKRAVKRPMFSWQVILSVSVLVLALCLVASWYLNNREPDNTSNRNAKTQNTRGENHEDPRSLNDRIISQAETIGTKDLTIKDRDAKIDSLKTELSQHLIKLGECERKIAELNITPKSQSNEPQIKGNSDHSKGSQGVKDDQTKGKSVPPPAPTPDAAVTPGSSGDGSVLSTSKGKTSSKL